MSLPRQRYVSELTPLLRGIGSFMPIVSCSRRRHAPILDEFSVQGLLSAEPAMHCCLFCVVFCALFGCYELVVSNYATDCLDRLLTV